MSLHFIILIHFTGVDFEVVRCILPESRRDRCKTKGYGGATDLEYSGGGINTDDDAEQGDDAEC